MYTFSSTDPRTCLTSLRAYRQYRHILVLVVLTFVAFFFYILLTVHLNIFILILTNLMH